MRGDGWDSVPKWRGWRQMGCAQLICGNKREGREHGTHIGRYVHEVVGVLVIASFSSVK